MRKRTFLNADANANGVRFPLEQLLNSLRRSVGLPPEPTAGNQVTTVTTITRTTITTATTNSHSRQLHSCIAQKHQTTSIEDTDTHTTSVRTRTPHKQTRNAQLTIVIAGGLSLLREGLAAAISGAAESILTGIAAYSRCVGRIKARISLGKFQGRET